MSSVRSLVGGSGALRILVVALGVLFLSSLALAEGPVFTANGGGVAVFIGDPAETTTIFGLGAAVFGDVVDQNVCAEDFVGIPIDSGVLAGDFQVANGHFLCKLKVPSEPGSKKKWLQVVITGAVTQGRDNGDGTYTLCGTATWVDSFGGNVVLFPDEPFALVIDPEADGGPTFHYWDSFNSIYGGDFEQVIKGTLKVKNH